MVVLQIGRKARTADGEPTPCWLRETAFYALVVACGVLAACGTADLQAPPITTDADATGLPNFADQGRIVIDPLQDACALQTIRPERVPLDLIFMFDTSGSMADLTSSGSSKWSAVRSAFAAFARSTDSSGVGAAVHFFPLAQPGIPAECSTNSQCGAFGPCTIMKACSNARGGLPSCISDADCAGTTGPCAPVGQCAVSPAYCTPIGGVCSEKSGDVCKALAGRCAAREICDAPSYAMGASLVTDLPAGASTLIRLLEAKVPEGMTPTGPALQGAIARAREQAMKSIGRRVAVVLATDGFPTSCETRSIDAIAQTAVGGLMATPSIPTFVVGVFTDSEASLATANLTRIANAGGTPKPFIISTSRNVADDFLAALNDIRATALACEYIIPASKTGEIDYEKVNLRFLTGTSANITIGNVNSAASCHPTKGGWYFDAAPPVGAPSKVLACPATCARFRGDPRGRVDLVVGCKTMPVE